MHSNKAKVELFHQIFPYLSIHHGHHKSACLCLDVNLIKWRHVACEYQHTFTLKWKWKRMLTVSWESQPKFGFKCQRQEQAPSCFIPNHRVSQVILALGKAAQSKYESMKMLVSPCVQINQGRRVHQCQTAYRYCRTTTEFLFKLVLRIHFWKKCFLRPPWLM